MKSIFFLPLATTLLTAHMAFAADEVHWTFTDQNSVTFDWRGTTTENTIGYGLTSGVYTQVTATTPDPAPVSSSGPFWEANLAGLTANTRYYYSIGNGPERSFRTPPAPGISDFNVYTVGNIGSTSTYFNTGAIQDIIANDLPSFVIGLGDLTLGSLNGAATVDQHFNDVMAWSKEAAYMPVWGDLEWVSSSTDSFNNYKGRFNVPNSQTSPGSPLAGGEDWYWFDYGNIRFITLPEPWSGAWAAWNTTADALMAQAQTDPNIKFIATFGHQPAYSSGHYSGSDTLKGMLDTLGDTYSKYVLNINGHSNNYERSLPQHGVTHVTAGTGGADLTQDGVCLWLTCAKPDWSAFRGMHLGALKLHFTDSGIEGSFICGPAGGGINDVNCAQGSVMDNFTIGAGALSAINSATVSATTATTANVLGNSGFESGATIWSASSGVIQNSKYEPAHSGSWLAALAGNGYTTTDNLYQTVTIPATVTSATLSFWLHIDTAETTSSKVFDQLAVQVQNSSGTALKTLTTYSNLNKSSGYVQKSFDLTAYKGQTIRIAFKGTEDYSLQTSFVLDDFLLGTTTSTTAPIPTGPSPVATLTVPGAAFPGAQGGGAGSQGGRGGAVIEVTNLNNAGTGSLRACIDATGPRTCVFRVAGTINLTTYLYAKNPYLTIAGQTAPGGGIFVSGKNSVESLLMIVTHDVVVRYMRMSKGYKSGSIAQHGSVIAIGTVSAHDIVIDHCSTSWNVDDNIGPWASGGNMTLSYNLVSEGLAPHATAIITGASSKVTAAGMTDIDMHHNLIMNDDHRGPILGNKSTRLVNNINYNMKAHAVQLLGGINVDIINNLYKRGPMSLLAYKEVEGLSSAVNWASADYLRYCGGSSNCSADSSEGAPSAYMSGNVGWNQGSSTGDQWAMAAAVSTYNGAVTGSFPSTWKRTAPLTNTDFPIIAEPVGTLERNLIPIVGASRRLACNGSWVSNRDDLDIRLIDQYNNNTGITSPIKTEDDVGGFPVIASGTACSDTDHDGMPDLWETARGLNPNSAADRNAISNNGYTNLDSFLSGI